ETPQNTSPSPTDAAQVFQIIVRHTTRLCEANFAAVYLRDQDRLHSAAHTQITPAFAKFLERGFDVNRATAAGRALLERRPAQVADVLTDPEFVVTPEHRSEGIRTVLAVPMLREGE